MNRTKHTAMRRNKGESNRPSAVQYVSPPPQTILDEDKLINRYRLDASSVEIVPVETIFEK